ncbi:MAG: NAD(P)-dependent oxidoreductase [Deltaproteobacteria bacterium]|nr:NAD(P)-dependent oxidoreductase [Candidatus Zymogenaceae bacterium]
MIDTVIVTGASGFLGSELLICLKKTYPKATIIPIVSPRQEKGIDLCDDNVVSQLNQTYDIPHPDNTLLIHAAAYMDWHSREGIFKNVEMATNIAEWAKSQGIGFNIFVSSVSVYKQSEYADHTTGCFPETYYGIGKLTSEHVWRMLLPEKNRSIIRFSGIWGWQRKPTLFWNKLLISAATDSHNDSDLVITRAGSKRNYISYREASNCLIHIAKNRLHGTFLAAGKDMIDTKTFIDYLNKQKDSKLSVVWNDDGHQDEIFFKPSDEILDCLHPFEDEMEYMWSQKPAWVDETA